MARAKRRALACNLASRTMVGRRSWWSAPTRRSFYGQRLLEQPHGLVRSTLLLAGHGEVVEDGAV